MPGGELILVWLSNHFNVISGERGEALVSRAVTDPPLPQEVLRAKENNPADQSCKGDTR